MRLVYEDSGTEVQVGDKRETGRGEVVEVTYFREPHKPSSSGKVSVVEEGLTGSREYYVGVIGAKWIEREDQIGW